MTETTAEDKGSVSLAAIACKAVTTCAAATIGSLTWWGLCRKTTDATDDEGARALIVSLVDLGAVAAASLMYYQVRKKGPSSDAGRAHGRVAADAADDDVKQLRRRQHRPRSTADRPER